MRRTTRDTTPMTDRDFILSLQAQIDAHLEGTPPTPEDGESPTGRRPKLVWTPDRQRCFNRMVSEREAGADTLGAIWADLIFDNAEGNRYADTGLWATVAYQMTGDPQWVEQAWRKIEPWLGAALDDANNNRELSLERVILLDWLWPGLTEARRTHLFEALDRMFTNCVLPNVRLNDSDQTTGVYMGVACYNAAFGDGHPRAHELFALPIVGGYDATARDRTTMRNAILDYLHMAAGGEWIESGEYNLGTVRLLTLGHAALRTATGAEHFPEIAAWLPTAGPRYPLMLTPDRRGSFQWGDEQNPHELKVFQWSATAMHFDHPEARRCVYDLVATYGATGYNSAAPIHARAFLLFDPYGPQAATTETLFDARGQGILTARTL